MKKGFQYQVMTQMFRIKFEDIIYKMVHANLKLTNFLLHCLGKSLDVLILVGLRNMIVGWSIANQKMSSFAFVVIFLHQTLENKEGVIVLWAKGIQIGKRMKDLTFMLEALGRC